MEYLLEAKEKEAELHERIRDLVSSLRESILDSFQKNKERCVVISYEDIVRVDPKVADALAENAEPVLTLLQEEVRRIIAARLYEEEEGEIKGDIRRITVHIKDFPDLVPINDIRSRHLGKFIKVRGIIKQITSIIPVRYEAVCKCTRCGFKFTKNILFSDDKEIECPRCKGEAEVEEVSIWDLRKITLEELPEDCVGRQPASIDVFLLGTLTESIFGGDSITPGTKVEICGYVKEARIKKSSLFGSIFVIIANYMRILDKVEEEEEITEEELQKIKEIASRPDLDDLLANTIAPSIECDKEIKLALALQIFGAPTIRLKDGTTQRGNIHILLVGDPGVGKSQLLRSVAKLAPKGIYVSGKSTTGVGLTATVTYDHSSKSWILEAGAVVLASGGILCIDEFDKIKNDDKIALHEAMAQQTISVNKANIHATLIADTSILAAANPKRFRFDIKSPIPEQIDIPATLLDRFDLIFAIIDVPDEKKDEKVARAVLRSFSKPEELKTAIPPSLFKKYVRYARKINPKIPDDVAEEFVKFYVELRKKSQVVEEHYYAIPMTPREIGAMVRLAMAHARARLRDVVTKEDFEVAKRLIMYQLEKLGKEEIGNVEYLTVDKLRGSSLKSKSAEAIIRDIIREVYESFREGFDLNEIKERAKDRGISEDQFEKIIKMMRKNGELLEVAPGKFIPGPGLI